MLTQTRWTPAEMERRIVRYADLRPCYNAFIDTRSPGSEAKENFTVIGPGVSENPDQHVHIAEPHGFNIGGARQPVGCVNSQHSHDTAEVFVVHSGAWRFDLGEHGDDAQVHLGPGDTISLPTGVFRGFTATAPAANGSPGYLFAILGGDDPGRVLWAPQVFDMARDYGLILLESGVLVDTAAGQTIPAGERPMPRTSAAQAAAMRVLRQEEAEQLIVRNDRGPGLIIGAGASLDWPHPFTLERLDDPCETLTPMLPEVVFVHRGTVDVAWEGGSLSLGAGDTMTIPIGTQRTIKGSAVLYRVCGVA